MLVLKTHLTFGAKRRQSGSLCCGTGVSVLVESCETGPKCPMRGAMLTLNCHTLSAWIPSCPAGCHVFPLQNHPAKRGCGVCLAQASCQVAPLIRVVQTEWTPWTKTKMSRGLACGMPGSKWRRSSPYLRAYRSGLHSPTIQPDDRQKGTSLAHGKQKAQWPQHVAMWPGPLGRCLFSIGHLSGARVTTCSSPITLGGMPK